MSEFGLILTKLLPLWAIAGIILVIILLHIKQTQRSKVNLEIWLNNNQFRLISVERRYLRRGPYLWKSSKGQVIFRISLANNENEEKIAWVKCGSYFKGAAFSDDLDVIFDYRVVLTLGIFGLDLLPIWNPLFPHLNFGYIWRVRRRYKRDCLLNL